MSICTDSRHTGRQVCKYIYIYTYIYTHIQIHIHMHTYTQRRICTYTHIRIYTYTHIVNMSVTVSQSYHSIQAQDVPTHLPSTCKGHSKWIERHARWQSALEGYSWQTANTQAEKVTHNIHTTHTDIRTYLRTYIHTLHTHIHIHTYAYKHVNRYCVYLHIYMCIYTHLVVFCLSVVYILVHVFIFI